MHTVLGDKEKIEDTIVELDYYKREALQSTWKIVNKLANKNKKFNIGFLIKLNF